MSADIGPFKHDVYDSACGYNGCTEKGCVPCMGMCLKCYNVWNRDQKSQKKTEDCPKNKK